jgi:hypothetical protein
MPDGVVCSHDFLQTFDQGPVAMGLSVTAGNTVIFDSFTPEEEVRRRNVANNNVSKLNQMSNRFHAEFCVGVRASSVTAILCANTVGNYRVVDKKTGDIVAASDKRPDYMRSWNEALARKQKVQKSQIIFAPSEPKRQKTFTPPIIIPANVVSTTAPPATIPGIFVLPHECTQPMIPPGLNELAHHVNHNLLPLPDIMTFTSSSEPPLSPRNLDDTAAPFPFKDQPTTSQDQQPPIFADLPPQPGTSDNIRAVVLVSNVMQHPPDIDDIQQGASFLQFLSRPKTATTRPTPPAKG